MVSKEAMQLEVTAESDSTPQTLNPEDKGETWLALIGIASLVLVLLGIYAWAVLRFVGGGTDGGVFGDMFGGANALFSGLAFAGLIYTILLQRRELGLQRDELRLTRTETTRQADQLAKQSDTFDQQQFDSTFFQLVQLHASILSGIELPNVGSFRQAGRGAFVQFKAELGQALPEFRTRGTHRKVAVQQAYERISAPGRTSLGHYFRNLYHIIKFVDGSRRTDAEKKQYTSFVRAQLSENETVVLFFNAQLARAAKFQPLIEKYALLEHLPIWMFDGEDPQLYKEAAFGDNVELLELRHSL